MDVSGSTHNIHASRFHRVSFSAEISHRGHAGNKHVLIRYCGQLMDGHRCKELIHSDDRTETVISGEGQVYYSEYLGFHYHSSK